MEQSESAICTTINKLSQNAKRKHECLIAYTHFDRKGATAYPCCIVSSAVTKSAIHCCVYASTTLMNILKNQTCFQIQKNMTVIVTECWKKS